MKKIINTFSQLACGCLMLASCKTTSSSIQQRNIDFDYINVAKKGIVKRPLVTDLSVSETKKTITKTYDNVSIELAKELITGDFSIENNCDVAVQPFFETNTVITEEKKKVTVTLTARPGFFKNIKHYDPLDSNTNKLLFNNFSNVSVVTVATPSNNVAENKVQTTTETSEQPASTKKVKNQKESKTGIKTTKKDGSKFGINALYAVPTGFLSDYFNSGLGLGINYKVPFSQKFSLNIVSDYFKFPGKTFGSPVGSVSVPDASIVSFRLGLRYKINNNLFVEPEFVKSLEFADYHENSIGYSIAAGYSINKKIEFSLAYNNLTDGFGGTANNYLTLRAGFYF